MTKWELINHILDDHGIDKEVAEGVIGTDEDYLRGFHDGMHGRVDADDLAGTGHADV